MKSTRMARRNESPTLRVVRSSQPGIARLPARGDRGILVTLALVMFMVMTLAISGCRPKGPKAEDVGESPPSSTPQPVDEGPSETEGGGGDQKGIATRPTETRPREAGPPQIPVPPFQLSIVKEDNEPTEIVVRVTADSPRPWEGLTDSLDAPRMEGILALRRANAATDTPANSKRADPTPAILGSYRIDGERLEFRPLIPLTEGENYRAVFQPFMLASSTSKSATAAESASAPALVGASARKEPSTKPSEAVSTLEVVYSVPKPPPGSPPEIIAVYPSGNIVPANHLKFYILFSEPMEQADIFQHFSLVNRKTGKPVVDPFRKTELWSRDGKRLTLWFHPGRQKTGVNLNVEIGSILEEENEYILRISENWKSAAGVPFKKDYEKRLQTGPADHTQPDPAVWFCFSTPRAGYRDPVRFQLLEPLDWALLQTQIRVLDTKGKPLEGTIQLGYGEMDWEFLPARPWSAGEHKLEVGPLLEDLAGNSIERPFNRDLTEKPTTQSGQPVYRAFEVVKQR